MAINETLKFSWGHIVAFLAIIFISYMSFMGLTYLTDGDFLIAGVGVAIIDILLLSLGHKDDGYEKHVCYFP